MWTLTYPGTIAREELLLRVVGPDRFDTALYYVDTVKYGREPEPEGRPVTYAAVVVLPPSETRVVRDPFGQLWLDPAAVEVDDQGVVRIRPVTADA